MKLKEQINKQRAYAVKMRNEAKKNNDNHYADYWLGIINAMEWVQGSRDEWFFIDGEPMSEDKGSAF